MSGIGVATASPPVGGGPENSTASQSPDWQAAPRAIDLEKGGRYADFNASNNPIWEMSG
jgi:hypothetical protein